MLSAISALSDLINPPKCICCKKYGKDICDECVIPWQAQAIETRLSAIPFSTVVKYDQFATPVILAAKEFGSQRAITLLTTALDTALRDALRGSWRELMLINIPSRPAANRKRGRDHSLELVRRLVNLNKCSDRTISHMQIFRHNRRVKDQANLDVRARYDNLHNSLSVKPELLPWLAGKDFIIVDDVVTSGATATEAIRALQQVGITPFWVIAAAANPRFFPIGYRY